MGDQGLVVMEAPEVRGEVREEVREEWVVGPEKGGHRQDH
jgi:hypothetical protein